MRYLKSFNESLFKINEIIKNENLIKSYVQKICDEVKRINVNVKTVSNLSELGSLRQSSDRFFKLNIRLSISNIEQEDLSQVIKILKKWTFLLEREDIILSYREPINSSGVINIYFKNKFTKRVFPNSWIFHFTKSKNASQILKYGLIPYSTKDIESNTRSGSYEYPKSVFAINDYGNRWSSGDTIFIIKTIDLKNRWWGDLNLYPLSQTAIMTFEPIPPDHIWEINTSQYNEICSYVKIGLKDDELDRKIMQILSINNKKTSD